MTLGKKIILIGGAPTTGKSTIAKQLSKHLGLPWISTDQIRDLMLKTVRAEDYPTLFNASGYTAERFLTELTTEQIVQMEFDQGEAVWEGVKNFIASDYTWKEGFIIEGVAILPELVAQDFPDAAGVRAVFLVDNDADRTRNVIFNRGLWAPATTYSDGLKEKEVEWTTLYSERLTEEAARYGYPCVEVRKHDDDLQTVLDALKF